MPTKASPDSAQNPTSSQFNARLPQLTHAQINDLAATHGLTKTQVIILAVDRILDMFRTTVNVYSDSVGAVVISRLEED